MSTGKALVFTLFLLATAGMVADVSIAEVLKRDPAMGALKLGQRVLVDDGSCPKAQIREVVGGDHIKVGGTQRIERQKRCIPRR